MFGSLGAPEILLIFVVALLVFGPRRLPEIGRKIGGIVRELRRSTGDFRATVEREIGLDPTSTGVEEVHRARRELLSAVSDPLRDAASGAREAVRDVREAVILPPDRERPESPAGAVPGTAPGRAPAPAESPRTTSPPTPDSAAGTEGNPSPASSGEPHE